MYHYNDGVTGDMIVVEYSGDGAGDCIELGLGLGLVSSLFLLYSSNSSLLA